MSRKDYQAFAAIIARHVYDLNDAGIALVADIADYFASDNERFDRERFANACVGLKEKSPEFQIQPKTYVGLALDEKGRERQ